MFKIGDFAALTERLLVPIRDFAAATERPLVPRIYSTNRTAAVVKILKHRSISWSICTVNFIHISAKKSPALRRAFYCLN